MNWTPPLLMDLRNEWASVGLVATQYVPSLPGKLVYTEVNFWMDGNSSASLLTSADGVARRISQPNLVVYHPIQVTSPGNQTMTIDLSAYLRDTLSSLGLGVQQSQPPVISYIYLNVEGYNFRWNGTLWSFYVLTPDLGESGGSGWNMTDSILTVVAVSVSLSVAVWAALSKIRPALARKGSGLQACLAESDWRDAYRAFPLWLSGF
jgi:hypothetical protein